MVGIYFWMIFCIIKQFAWIPFNSVNSAYNISATVDKVERTRKVGQVFYVLVIVVTILSGCWYFQVCQEESDAAALSVDTINPKVKRINWRNWPTSIFFFFVGLDFYWYSINYLHKNESQVLVRSGIYSCCRHPAYFSLLLQFMAMSLHTYRPARNILSLLLLTLSCTYFIVFRIPEEERHLKTKFGASWTAYKRSTTNNCGSGIRGILSYFYHLFDPTAQIAQNSPTHKLLSADATVGDVEHSESLDDVKLPIN